MIDRGVGKRYAAALFGASQKANALDQVMADLDALEGVAHENPGFLRFLSSPQELDENKEALVRKLFDQRAHELLTRLLLLLLRKGRILHLLDVIEDYRSLVEEEWGIVAAKVVTAIGLEEDLGARLTDELERMTRKKIRLQSTVDPQIIGGLIVFLGGKVYDRSVRRDLERLQEDLLAARVH